MEIEMYQPVDAMWDVPQVDAPAAAPPPPPPPPPAAPLPPGVTAAPPPEWAAALAAAGVSEYGEMPWDAMPPAPNYVALAAGMGLEQEGQALMQQLADMGKLTNVGTNGNTLGQEIVDRLQSNQVTPETATVIMRQLVDPDNNIGQFGPNTCAAATAQKAMATADPNLYFVTAADFLQAGQANLPNGQTVVLSQENRSALSELNLTPEQQVNGAFQGALMDHANGDHAYNVVTDTSTRPDGSEYRGLSYRATRDLAAAALGAPMLDGAAIMADWTYQTEAYHLNGGPNQNMNLGEWGYYEFQLPAPALLDVVASHLQSAQNRNFPGVMVAMTTPEGNQHLVMVSKINAQNGTLTVSDATGAPRQMSLSEFTNNVYLGAQSNDDGGIGGWTGWTPAQTASTGRGRG